MSDSRPISILVRYRVKPGKQQEFETLLKKHWQTLQAEGLTTKEPARVQRASDRAGNVAYIERFDWKSPAAVQSAHESPAVMKLWEPMGALCDDMEFWNVEAFEVG
jgi:quinol monooxygenase YgiN